MAEIPIGNQRGESKHSTTDESDNESVVAAYISSDDENDSYESNIGTCPLCGDRGIRGTPCYKCEDNAMIFD